VANNKTKQKAKQMKQSEIVAAVMAGEMLVVGTYLSGKVDSFSGRDSKNEGGPRKLYHVKREIIITATEPLVISQFMKDGETPETWKPSAKSGQKVICRITGMEKSREGIVVLKGSIEELV